MSLPDDFQDGSYANQDWEKIFDILERNKQTTKAPQLRPLPAAPVEITPSFYSCDDRMVFVDTGKNSSRCAFSCQDDVDVFFTKSDRVSAERLMTSLAAVCLVTSLLIVITFALDTTRFVYPERPIVCMAICHVVYSSTLLVRAVVGARAISCEMNSNDDLFVIMAGLESTWCTVVFALLYFFNLASALWWLILTLGWFLEAARKWGSEAIQGRSSYFHIAAWSLPALATIVVLVKRKVDGDLLTGLCFAGNQDPLTLAIYVILPEALCLLLGCALVVAGFVSLTAIRWRLKQNGGTSGSLKKNEKLIAKMVIFSALYVTLRIANLTCLVYEALHMDEWQTSLPPCDVIEDSDVVDCTLDTSIPVVHVFLLKIVTSLGVGVVCGVWICSRKTLDSWRAALCCEHARKDVKSGTSGAPSVNTSTAMNYSYQKAPTSQNTSSYYPPQTA